MRIFLWRRKRMIKEIKSGDLIGWYSHDYSYREGIVGCVVSRDPDLWCVTKDDDAALYDNIVKWIPTHP